jgi:hypothetical protein
VILNGHEYVACQARKAGISFTKEGNCFTHISDAVGLAKIADTLSGQRTIGRLSQACEHWISVEKPTYDLTIFKLHRGKLTLKIYTKGERVLRIEVVVHNTEELRCGRSLEKFPEIVVQAKSILERFMEALSCIDQCYIADRMLEQLPAPSQVGKTKVGGIDFNKSRMLPSWPVRSRLSASKARPITGPAALPTI